MSTVRGRMNAIGRRLATCLALFAFLVPAVASAATPPYVQLIAAPLAAGTCDPSGPIPSIAARVDLGPTGTYRYSPAFFVPYYFDDEGEFNLVWNQDVTLFVSGYLRVEGVDAAVPLPLAPLATWFEGFGRLPEQTELALRVATYDASGRAVAASRISWNCTTGAIKSVEHRGNALGPAVARLVEYYHAALDHYFVTADAAEIGALDGGTHAGWQRTGQTMGAYLGSAPGFNAVCRFYMPPSFGDSHFYSASPAECSDVRVRFPGFVYESPDVFAVALPDAGGTCPASTVAVYRLWNGRVDSNHRYTADPAIRDAMRAKGYVPEGYGPAAVAFCALP